MSNDLAAAGVAPQPACLNCDEPVAESVDGVGLRAERDAALAAIERVREIHRPTMPGYGPKACVHDGRAWPCQTIAALDGAPEPEAKP